MEAASQRRALDDALERHGSPCESDPDAWFPTTTAGRLAAEDACLDCEAFVECSAYADAMEQPKRFYGVWAGRLRGLESLQITDDDNEGAASA